MVSYDNLSDLCIMEALSNGNVQEECGDVAHRAEHDIYPLVVKHG